jgi:hypothetical protein
MFGTNENISAAPRMSASGLSSVTSGADTLSGSDRVQLSLQELLHKAWLVLSSKS